MARNALVTLLEIVASFGLNTGANAVVIGNSQGNADFPGGAASFADVVVDYSPAISGGEPTEPNRDPSRALGTPDYAGPITCTLADCPYVSLGSGGSITLRFADNFLTGSGDNSPDLFVFEVGSDIEDTFVEISADGSTWAGVGKVFGSFSTIDIDAFGFDQSDSFSHLRLTDDANEGGTSGPTAGADIDAVGAISTRLVVRPIPEPASFGLFALGLMVLGWGAYQRERRVAIKAA